MTAAPLAYVFWHSPAHGVSTDAYEESLTGFHRALRDSNARPAAASSWWRVDGAAWLEWETAYEDWYLVEDFAALGRLNEAAVDIVHRGAHDGVASLAANGAAGVYRLRQAGAVAAPFGLEGNPFGLEGNPFGLKGNPFGPEGTAVWFSKPAGMQYSELFRSLAGQGPLWQRQMTLGPTPELCLSGPGAAGLAGAPLTASDRSVVTRSCGWHSGAD